MTESGRNRLGGNKKPLLKLVMGLVFGGKHHVGVQRRENFFGGGLTAFGIPLLKGDDRARQRFRNDLVLDRPEQHVGNRHDEGQENEKQQRRDQHQRPHLLKQEQLLRGLDNLRLSRFLLWQRGQC